METIGERIQRLRASRGWTQEQLGNNLNVSDKAVSSWENGTRVPRMGIVENMALIFKVNKSYIIDGTLNTEEFDGSLITAEEYALLKHFRQISSDQQSMVLGMVEAASKQSQYNDKHKR